MKIVSCILLALTWTSVFGQEVPPLPYIDWGACPFECYTYGEWEVIRPVDAYSERSVTSKITLHLKKGQRVNGITGVVVTTQSGVVRILSPIKIGYSHNDKSEDQEPKLSLKAGDIVYTLEYLGEGNQLIWYQGNIYWDDQLYSRYDSVSTESSPKTEWWVKIKDYKGHTGWTKETKAFAHKDACE